MTGRTPSGLGFFAPGGTLRRAEHAASGSGIGDGRPRIDRNLRACPSHPTHDKLLAGKSRPSSRPSPKPRPPPKPRRSPTMRPMRSCAPASYQKRSPAAGARFRLPARMACHSRPRCRPTMPQSSQQPRTAITQDEAEFLAHAERLFAKAQAAVVAYNQLLKAPLARNDRIGKSA